jgi:mRNA interferase MazF
MKRGDVVLVRFPHPTGLRGKKRPAVIIQSDSYSGVVRSVVVAEVTTNMNLKNDPACLFIDVSTAEGRATGIVRDSVISCLVLVTVYSDTIERVLGRLSHPLIQKLDDSIRAALGLT